MNNIKIRWILLLALFFLCSNEGRLYAMDTTSVHKMLVLLQEQQSDGSKGFSKGLFPSYRQYRYRPDILKDDDNLFFTASVLYILNNLYEKLPEKDQAIVRQISSAAIPAFARFKNKDGKSTYNFWSTNPPKVFPNSGWMNWFDQTQSLPDDFDDTSVGLLAIQADTSIAQKVHQYMQHYVNRPGKRIKNTFKRYHNVPAYSVWFGKKFPVDFDICVLANTLTFVSSYQLNWTQADTASLRLIDSMITHEDILQHPSYISPHYHTTAIILYHLSRLTSVNATILLPYRQQLAAEAIKLWKQSDNPIEKAMLTTALKRWGVSIPETSCQNSDPNTLSELTYSNFVYFIANMASMLPNPLKSILGKSGIGRFNYYCPAINIALVLECELTDIDPSNLPTSEKR